MEQAIPYFGRRKKKLEYPDWNIISQKDLKISGNILYEAAFCTIASYSLNLQGLAETLYYITKYLHNLWSKKGGIT